MNEEDGLDFRITLENDGNRRLEAFWRDQRLEPSQLPKTLENDARWDIFRLRALVMLQERVDLQASHLKGGDETFTDSKPPLGVRNIVWVLIRQLRTLEAELLSMFYQALEGKVGSNSFGILKS